MTILQHSSSKTSMSAEQFSKLSLGDAMVTTRAGAAKAARASPRSLQDLEHDQPLPSIESSPPVSPTPSLVISTNNLQYNVSAFDSDLRRRAKRGLEENEIRMKYCAVSDDEHSPDRTKYFYLDDDITVAMGGKLRRPKCTCGANDGGLACKVSSTPPFTFFTKAAEAHILGRRPNHVNRLGESQGAASSAILRWFDVPRCEASRIARR